MRLFYFLALLFSLHCAFAQKKNVATVVINTHEGPFEVTLNLKETPNAAKNFLLFCKKGYYHDVTFNILVQGIFTKLESTKILDSLIAIQNLNLDNPTLKDSYQAGSLIMIPTANLSGYQFYITHQKQKTLNFQHIAFGFISKGFNNFSRLEKGDPILSTQIIHQ